MPQRFLRPGITTSERWNACDWFTQSFYIRLLTLVDDYGRFEASPRLLKALAFPFSDGLDLQTIANSCEQLRANRLAVFYSDGDKQYLQILRWQERARSKSKYPNPPANSCEQMTADVVKCSPPSPSSSPSSPPSPEPSPTPPPTPAALRNARNAPVTPGSGEGVCDEQKSGGEDPNTYTPPMTTAERLAALEAKRLTHLPPNGKPPALKLKEIINRIYRRTERDKWACEEDRMLSQVVINRPDWEQEAKLIEASKPGRGRYFPQKVLTLLNDWTGNLDIARNPEATAPRMTRQQIEDAISRSPANRESTFHRADCSQADKDRLRELRGMLK